MHPMLTFASIFGLPMIIQPKVRGFLYTTHPTGCLENVRRQMSHVRAKGPIPEGPSGYWYWAHRLAMG